MKNTILHLGNGPEAKDVINALTEIELGHGKVLNLQPYLEKLGVVVTIGQVKSSHSDLQRRGFHWLLRQWLRLDPCVSSSLDQLKDHIYKNHFGVFRLFDEHGNEYFKALRTTTTEWSWDNCAYVSRSLSKELYTGLIEYVYHMAAEDDVVLPDLDPMYNKEFTRKLRAA